MHQPQYPPPPAQNIATVNPNQQPTPSQRGSFQHAPMPIPSGQHPPPPSQAQMPPHPQQQHQQHHHQQPQQPYQQYQQPGMPGVRPPPVMMSSPGQPPSSFPMPPIQSNMPMAPGRPPVMQPPPPHLQGPPHQLHQPQQHPASSAMPPLPQIPPQRPPLAPFPPPIAAHPPPQPTSQPAPFVPLAGTLPPSGQFQGVPQPGQFQGAPQAPPYPSAPGPFTGRPAPQQPPFVQSQAQGQAQGQFQGQIQGQIQGQGQVQPMPPQQQSATPNRINPALVPSPLTIIAAENERFRDGPFYTSQLLARTSPPRAFADPNAVQIIDDGNSSSRLIRCSAWTLPIGEEACEYTRLTLAISLQPFAVLPAHEPPIPVVDCSGSGGSLRGPIRCIRCRGYINPHVQWVRGGRAWACNLCGAGNDCPDDYFAQLDATGRRVDLAARPELRCGTVDLVVTSPDYVMRPILSAARLLFLIDSSRSAVQSGAFRAALDAVRAICHSPAARHLYSAAALVTFDRSVHFYDIRPSALSGSSSSSSSPINGQQPGSPRVSVMSDLTDPFLPLAASALFFPLAEEAGCLATLDRLLDQMLLQLFPETRVVESCLGAAVAVSMEALRSTGGRVVLFASTLPNVGPGALKNRESAVPASQLDKSNPLLLPQGDYYPRLAAQAATNGISMTLCATPSSFFDLATVGVLSAHTSGPTLLIPRFTFETHGRQLVSDVLSAVTRPFVFDCIARVRCGQGLQPGEYVGSCLPMPSGQSRPDVLFGALSCDQSFAVSLTYDGKLSETEPTGIQCAILHTTPAGQRRIRIINLALPALRTPVDIYRSVEPEAMVSFLSKRLVGQLHAAPLAALSGYVISRVSNVLAAYRKIAASNVSSSQLILPEELKLLPLLALSLNKSSGLSPATANMDSRVHALRLLADLPHDLLLPFFYPRLVSVLAAVDCPPGTLPPCLRLSRESLDRQGIYLLENGIKIFLWVGDLVSSSTLSNIFGVGQLGEINPFMTLPQFPNPLSKTVNVVVGKIRSERSHQRFLSLQIVRPGIDHAAEAEWLQALVEDSSPAGASYVDFLCRLHSQIQTDMASVSGSLLSDRSALLNFFH